ncbi:MAG: polysaccharide biosynthesis tyrosine autokinase [Alphaproteobacteria bacterium]
MKTIKQNDYRWMVVAVRRHLASITLLVLLASALAAAYAVLREDEYTAYAEILVEPDNNEFGDLAEENNFLPATISPNEMETELRLLTSSRVLFKVIEKLGLTFEPSGLGRVKTDMWSWISAEAKPLEVADEAQKFRSFRDRMTVERDPLASTITIGYRSTDPKEAAKVADTIADVYLADRLDAKRKLFNQTASHLEARVNDMAEWLRKEEAKIEEYRAEADLYDVSGSSPIEQRYATLTNQLTEAKLGLTDAQARLSQAKGPIAGREDWHGIDLESIKEVQSSPVISDLRRQESEIRRRIGDLSSQYGRQHPVMRNARAELDGVRSSITAEIKRIVDQLQLEVEVAKNRVGTIQAQLDEAEQELSTTQSSRIHLREMERDIAGPRRVYEMMLDRYQRSTEQEKLVTDTARVIGPAIVPDAKSQLSGMLLIGIAGFCAGSAGVGLALLREIGRPGYTDADELEADVGYPVLSIVPWVRRSSKEDAVKRKRSLEAFGFIEAIRSVIQVLMSKRPSDGSQTVGKVVALTSCFPNEGKTTLALSLARQASVGGVKAILIEGDLRKDGMQTKLKTLDADKGLIHLLKGEASIEEIIQNEPSSGVDVILGLGPSKEAFSLTRSAALRQLFDVLRQHYELIVLDCGPLLGISDTRSLVGMADEVVLVVRWQTTERSAVATAVRGLERQETPIAGLVMTQVDLAEHMRYGNADSLHYQDRYHAYATEI